MSGPLVSLPSGAMTLAQFDDAPQRARRVGPVVFHRLDRLPPRAPRHEVISGLAAAGEVVALVAAPGAGKSAIAALLAYTVAAGETFLGRDVTPGTVLYVAAERAAEVERRLKAAAPADAAIFVSGARPQLADAGSLAELLMSISAVMADVAAPIRLIIIDTAARCLRNLDENSARDMGLAAEGMARIVEACPTAVLLIIHHLGKGGSTMRGSGALLGAVDLELTVKRSGDSRRLEVTKANAVAEGQRLAFLLTPLRGSDGLDVILVKQHRNGTPDRLSIGTPS